MTMIKVEALRREGHSYRACAQRFFPSGEAVDLEVLDQEDDFEIVQPDGSVTYDPATTIEIDVANSTTGRLQKAKRPHPTRIGQRAYREIKEDQVLRIMEGGSLSGEISQAALDAARRQASDLAGKLVDAESGRAEAGAKLEAALAELAEAKAALEAAKAGSKPAEVPPAGDAPPADKGNGGKGGKAK